MTLRERTRPYGRWRTRARPTIRRPHLVCVRAQGRLQLVDLAGSERVLRSEVAGERLREAQHINRSLSSLGDVMAALQEKRSHVPFRDSMLTRHLMDSLSGGSKVLMLAHIDPSQVSAPPPLCGVHHPTSTYTEPPSARNVFTATPRKSSNTLVEQVYAER